MSNLEDAIRLFEKVVLLDVWASKPHDQLKDRLIETIPRCQLDVPEKRYPCKDPRKGSDAEKHRQARSPTQDAGREHGPHDP